MTRFAGWLWRRYRAYFPFPLVVVGWLIMVVGLLPPVLAGLSLWFGLDLGDTFLVGGAAALALLAGPVITVSQRRYRREMAAWGRGDRSDPVAAWQAAVHAPPRWTERATLINSVSVGLLVVPVLASRGHLIRAEVLLLVPATLVIEAGLGLVVGTGFALLLRPMLDDIAPHLPPVDVVATPARWSLLLRFYVAIASTCFVTGTLVASAVHRTHTRTAALAATFGASTLLGAYMLVLFGGLLVRPTLRPLGDLTAALSRVRRGDYDQAVPVTTADEFGQLVAAFNEMQRGLREREALQSAFGSYVDPGLAQRLLSQGSAIFDGEEVVVSVLFADVRGFTSFSESATPSEAVERLNHLFDVVVPALHERGGHANHYLGDGLLAVFGAPQPLPDHADAAVAAAVQIQQRVREVFGDDLRLGIGINTGPVIAGTVGGGGRHEFTVIGDTVNVAARVEQLTKETGDAILITDATRMALSAPRPRSRKRGGFAVRGKAAPVTLHAVTPFPRSAR